MATSASNRGGNLDGLLGQGRQWEEAGEYQRAIETYLKVDSTNTRDPGLLAAAWTRAGELAIKFLETDKAEDVANLVGPRLVELGRYSAAAQLYLGVEMVREAIDAFIDGEEWAKAKKVAKELEPRLEGYVDEKYKTFLRAEGKAEQLASVDLMSALDMYAEQGNWNKAISTAAGHGPEVLHKYVALYATQLIKEGQPEAALDLYRQYGAPPFPANFNIYKRIGLDLYASRSLADEDGADSYQLWAALRDMYFGLCETLSSAGSSSPAVVEEFGLLLLIAHYYAVRAAALPHKQLADIAAKVAVAMLRHSDVIPADKDSGHFYIQIFFIFLLRWTFINKLSNQKMLPSFFYKMTTIESNFQGDL